MKFLFKFRNEILLSILLIASYFLLRLVFIGNLPMFTDEAIYTRWAQIALNDSAWRFISLTDGKQPMFVWAAILTMKFINDPLIAARLVSVVSGFFTMIGVFVLTYELFKNKRVAFLASIIYIFYPFAQVLDRMALYDSMVGTFFVWATYFSVLLVRKVRLDIAYTLGFVIAAGVLTKTANFFSIYLLPFTLLLFDFKKKPVGNRILRWVLFTGFGVAIAYGLYNVLRLSPLFEMITLKNAIFVYPLNEWLQHPFTFFIGNLYGLLSWLFEYLNIPYIILIAVSYLLITKFTKEKIFLTLYFALPFVALALFGRIIFPRFIFFMSLMLLPLAALGLEELISFMEKRIKLSLPKTVYTIVLTALFVSYPLFVCLQFAASPINSKIAYADNRQYINSWAAGWGVKESVEFFRDKAKTQKIFVATQGTFGLMPQAMELYLINNKNITIKGYWPVDNVSKEVLEMSKKMPTYFIFYQKELQVMPQDFPLKLVFEVRQGDRDSFYRLYQVIPR
ncbi:MAG: glycosyltransferase family 39 protein [Candidatus Levybacteria bacterium]|nr:glycosyltransferase family 39 protein [Candidatus Levybacteria bacterium]